MKHLSFLPKSPSLIGMVHLKALPGSPGFQGNMDRVLEQAVSDARTLETGGGHALIIENFWDSPFPRTQSPPITVSAVTVCVKEIQRNCSIPVGINILRNDAVSALSVAAAASAAFIRVNVLTYAMVTDQGIIEGCSYELSRLKAALGSKVAVFADVMVKHAAPVSGFTLETAAIDTAERGGADALIVSGSGTGRPITLDDARRIKEAVPGIPLASGSGITPETIPDFLPYIDIFIIGTALKKEGRIENPVDPERVKTFSRMLEKGMRK